jgi:hypothetical protein
MVQNLPKSQLIHIVSEIILLLSIVFWFQKKTASMNSKLQELSSKITEQDEIIKSHDVLLSDLINNVTILNSRNNKKTNFHLSNNKPNNKPKPKPVVIIEETKNNYVSNENVSENNLDGENQTNQNETNQNQTEDELDDEIREELSELEDNNE